MAAWKIGLLASLWFAAGYAVGAAKGLAEGHKEAALWMQRAMSASSLALAIAKNTDQLLKRIYSRITKEAEAKEACSKDGGTQTSEGTSSVS
jgi:hypothetical protein